MSFSYKRNRARRAAKLKMCVDTEKRLRFAIDIEMSNKLLFQYDNTLRYLSIIPFKIQVMMIVNDFHLCFIYS